jgi:hypothetical protein
MVVQILFVRKHFLNVKVVMLYSIQILIEQNVGKPKKQCMKKHRILETPQNFATSQVDIPPLKKCNITKNKYMQLSTMKTLQFSHILDNNKFAGINSFMVIVDEDIDQEGMEYMNFEVNQLNNHGIGDDGGDH